MKLFRTARLIMTAALLLLLLLPFCIIKIDAAEQPLGDVVGVATKMNRWLNDHADFRKLKVRELTWKLFKASPTSSLVIGKDGWVFISDLYDDNVKIARGTYPYPQETIDQQMDVLSNLKKYYSAIGSDLYVLPYPANMSVYPEVVPDGDYTVGESPIDVFSENLAEHTDVNVINPKWQMIEDKGIGQIYCKRDTHATDLGAFAVYKVIARQMKSTGGIELLPFDDMTFVDGEYALDSNGIAGVPDLFGATQTAPVAVCELTAKYMDSGAFYEQISAAISGTGIHELAVYETPDAKYGTLLIYGTSVMQFDNIGEKQQLTRWLAENFKRTVFIWYAGYTFPNIDSIVAPDVTLLEIPERLLNGFLTEYHSVPIVASASDIENIQQSTNANDIGDGLSEGGICLETCGTQLLQPNVECDLGAADSIVLTGWAEDANTQAPLQRLYLKIGEQIFQCNYGINRPDVSARLGYPEAANYCGFQIELPRLLFAGVSDLEFIGISTDGSCKYPPVIYHIHRTY